MIILGLYLYDVTREGNRNEKDTEEDEDPVKREEAEKLLKLEETKGKDIKVLENDAKIYKNTLKCFEHREKQMNAKVNEAINNRNIQKDKSKKKTMALMDMAGKI
tara:strand:+ start:144 stop:458 length:315 start_codon:yes stop_codon:yes gene_type:complete